MVISLFEDWTRMYGSKLQGRQNLDLRTAELWTVGLKKLGVTQKEFEKAAEESICLKWPPTCVEDFVALVRVNTNAYPDSHTAFVFACQNEGKTADVKQAYEHVVVYETVKRLGGFALKNANNKYFDTWDKVYQTVCQEHTNGADFTLPVESRVEYSPVFADSESVDDYITKAMAILAGVTA